MSLRKAIEGLNRRRALRIAVACGLPLVALPLGLWLDRWTGHTSYQVFLAAVAASALYGGFRSGLATLALSGIAKYSFFLLPHASERVELRLVLFLLLGILVAWLAGEIRAAQQRLAAALASIGDAVAMVDAKEQILFLNPVAEALSGWTSQDARGRRWQEVLRFVNDQGQPLESPFGAPAVEGKAGVLAEGMLLIARDGSQTPVEDSAAPIRDAGGHVQGMVLVLRDVSRRRELEEQLRHAQKMEALGRLAGGVAHDFNNLLTVIRGYTDLVRQRLVPGDATSQTALEEIQKASERSARLASQLLAFSRRQVLQPKPLNLNEIILHMQEMLGSLLGTRITLRLSLDHLLEPTKIDPGQMEQVIMNLIVNARDAMPGGGTATIRTANVELNDPLPGAGQPAPGGYVMLQVRDTGQGMDDRTRERIFEPFFSTKPKGRGTGLGLAIVYGIVQQSGGAIQVSSKPGQGAVFSIYLPRTSESQVAEEPQPARTKPDQRGHTVLIAEDEAGVRDFMAAVLRAAHHTVLEARDGSEAARLAAENLNRLDLVVTDLHMPGLNGWQLIERLKVLRPDLKILMVSGAVNPPEVGANGSSQDIGFLAKPFGAAALSEEVERMLSAKAEPVC